MSLRIILLGLPEVSYDGHPVDMPGHRPLALLAYLLITEKAHSRDHLADLLFDRPGDPRAALRWTLSKLRNAIGQDYISSSRKEITFNFESDYWLDVAAFEAGEPGHYRGEFLEGMYIRDSRQYESWMLAERDRLKIQYQSRLERNLEKQQQLGDTSSSIETARQLLLLDNLREDWHRALMSSYALQGNHEAALTHYEQCRKLLLADLDTEPAEETVVLARAIREEQARLYKYPAANSAPLTIEEQLKVTDSPTTIRDIAPGTSRSSQSVSSRRQRRTIIVALGLLLLTIILILGIIVDGGKATETDRIDNDSGDGTLARELAGKTVTIVSAQDESTVKLVDLSMLPFEERTGIDVIAVPLGEGFEEFLIDSRAANSLPDIVQFPQPGFLADFARKGEVVDLRTFMDDTYLQQQYPQELLKLAEVNDQMAGIWYAVSVKSLVWYSKQAFEKAGYEVPQTWDELMSLSDQIVADGGTPWCLAIESGDSTGWVGTDWVEDILLRTAPPETYDSWVGGELGFDSPEIRRVFRIMEFIWLNDTFIYGGTENIVSERLTTSPLHLFDDPPGCYLHKQASWIQYLFPEDVNYGEDYDFFALPPIDPEFGQAVLGGGDVLAMFNDRPEVREVMRYLTTGESVKAFVEAGVYISPHRDTLFEWYSSSADLRFAQMVLDADTYQYDGSDLMPPEVGVDSFWKGIVAWVEGAELETILQEIDNSWPDD